MESLVKDAILQHMLHNNLFTIAQHGFLPLRNYVSQLLETMELWCEYIEGNVLTSYIQIQIIIELIILTCPDSSDGRALDM